MANVEFLDDVGLFWKHPKLIQKFKRRVVDIRDNEYGETQHKKADMGNQVRPFFNALALDSSAARSLSSKQINSAEFLAQTMHGIKPGVETKSASRGKNICAVLLAWMSHHHRQVAIDFCDDVNKFLKTQNLDSEFREIKFREFDTSETDIPELTHSVNFDEAAQAITQPENTNENSTYREKTGKLTGSEPPQADPTNDDPKPDQPNSIDELSRPFDNPQKSEIFNVAVFETDDSPMGHGDAKIGLRAKVIWRLITDPDKFHDLGFPGLYSKFNKEPPTKGAITKTKGLGGGRSYPRYVVDYEANTRFSIGLNSEEWVFKWELIEHQDHTEVFFARKFGQSSFFLERIERIFTDKQKEEAMLRRLLTTTMENLIECCKQIELDRFEHQET